MSFTFSMLEPSMHSAFQSNVPTASKPAWTRTGPRLRRLLPPSLVLALLALGGAASAQEASVATAAPTQMSPVPTASTADVPKPVTPASPVAVPAAPASAAPTAPTVDDPAQTSSAAPAATPGHAGPAPSVAPAVAPNAGGVAAAGEPEQPLSAVMDVAVVVQSAWNTSPAYDYFSDDNHLLMGGLSLALDVVSPAPATIVALDVTAITGETEFTGPLPQYISNSTLRRTDVGAGLSLRHHLWSWLAPYARVSGAAAFEDATVTSLDFGQLDVEETNFVGTVGCGLTLYSPAKRISNTRRSFNSLAFRLSAEGGYQFVGAIPFEVPAETMGSGITRAAVPLGELEQSGAYLRVAAGARF